ncbi:unnamed protein product [Macrosiphum euphorbiae]|uniref:Uncharacterized protein n=1 Tax=Macrosiphum euphorbiae TaxID=13131 RepID=A0AAV0VYG3_9HEMI|nr:unnamed protein product [Macrosiphum euphorbiae]
MTYRATVVTLHFGNGTKPLDTYGVSGKPFKTNFLELGFGNRQRRLLVTFGGYASAVVRQIAPDVITVYVVGENV